MNALIEKIDTAIEHKAMNTNRMGTEPVTVVLVLTDAERDTFYHIKKYDSNHYSWELNGNELAIRYMEDC